MAQDRYGQIFKEDLQIMASLKRNDVIVYAALLYHAKQIYKDKRCRVRQCFMSQKTLSVYLNISTRSVARGIAQLKKIGVLTVKQNKITSGLYTITTQDMTHVGKHSMTHVGNQDMTHVGNECMTHVGKHSMTHVGEQTNNKQNNNKHINKEENNIHEFEIPIF